MAKVLMFHRILPEKLISYPNCYTEFGTLITQEYLENILSLLLKHNYHFVTMSELIHYDNTDNMIALTFDDGYFDNYVYAKRSLEKYQATATFFPVVSPCKNNSVLPLDIYYQCVDETILSDEERSEYVHGETKRKFYWTAPEYQMELLDSYFEDRSEISRVNYMSAKQLKQLSDCGFEIGSHGMTHSLLTADYMNHKKILYELQSSKDWLESVTGSPITAYCFPAGRYNTSLIATARESGYTSTSLVYRNTSGMEALPSYERIFVKPDSLDELKKEIGIE